MISKDIILINFLLCLKDIFVYIRYKIDDLHNIEILEVLNQHVTRYLSTGDIDYQNFLKKIQPFVNLEMYRIINKNLINEVSAMRLKEIGRYLQIIKLAIEEIFYCFEEKNYHQAYDLVDAIHALPEALLYKEWNARSYWQCYIKLYRNKWNEHFLVREEKNLY